MWEPENPRLPIEGWQVDGRLEMRVKAIRDADIPEIKFSNLVVRLTVNLMNSVLEILGIVQIGYITKEEVHGMLA